MYINVFIIVRVVLIETVRLKKTMSSPFMRSFFWEVEFFEKKACDNTKDGVVQD